MTSPYQSFNFEEQQTMSEHVNRMLEILKDMSKSIPKMEVKMQDSWYQIIEVLDEQSNVILQIKEQSKVQESHEILENQSDVLQASSIIIEL